MDFNSPKNKIAVLTLAALIVLVSADRALGAPENGRISVISAAQAAVVYAPGTAEPVEPKQVKTFETVQGKLLDVCQSRGYDEDCARTMLGMLWKESLNDAQAIGDGGQARGYFQIWYRLHNISIDCAEDLECSANWTLDYLESNGYPHDKVWAVQCHNGCNIWNGYWQSALRWGDRKWNTPLFIDQPNSALASN